MQTTPVLAGITSQQPSTAAIIALALAALLLLLTAFTSASENAFFSLSATDRNTLEEKKTDRDRKICRLLDDQEYLLATIMITGNLANVATVVLCYYFFIDVFGTGAGPVGFVLLTAILALLLLLFSEILPKMYSTSKALQFCRFAAPGISFLRTLFYPLSALLVRSLSSLHKYRTPKPRNISVDELSQALEMTDQKDISNESNILKGIIRFGGETAQEVMTSRMDVVALDIRTPFKEVLKCVTDNVYSRIPVYQGSMDTIKGVLYIKDLLPHISKGDNFRWQTLVRPAYFVPETKMIDDLLREFQANKVHIAIVVDEFGGTSGIVTMEDIIEEIVGEIHDEYDDDEHTSVKLDDNNWIFQAKTLLTDFYKETGLDDTTFDDVAGEADTISGLLLEIKGDFPALHEKLTCKNYRFEVLALDNRRILKVKFTILPPEEVAPSGDGHDRD